MCLFLECQTRPFIHICSNSLSFCCGWLGDGGRGIDCTNKALQLPSRGSVLMSSDPLSLDVLHTRPLLSLCVPGFVWFPLVHRLRFNLWCFPFCHLLLCCGASQPPGVALSLATTCQLWALAGSPGCSPKPAQSQRSPRPPAGW